MLKQWDALNEYCRNGWVELDNNLCENALRVVALGRRNYMFFGSDGGGDSAAVMYSLIGSCKLNGFLLTTPDCGQKFNLFNKARSRLSLCDTVTIKVYL